MVFDTINDTFPWPVVARAVNCSGAELNLFKVTSVETTVNDIVNNTKNANTLFDTIV